MFTVQILPFLSSLQIFLQETFDQSNSDTFRSIGHLDADDNS